MARAATTLDAFNALAEPKRREVLGTIGRVGGSGGAGGEVTVTTIVHSLGWPQPQVSKHLAVLREVGLVSVRRKGRERMYSVNGAQLKTIHDWVGTFEQFWTHQLDRIKQRAESAGGHPGPRLPDSNPHSPNHKE